MNTRISLAFIFTLAILSRPAITWPAHPLTTDDTGTQGQGNFQLEVNGEYDHDKSNGFTADGGQAAAAFTCGVMEKVDLAVGIPYAWVEEDANTKENGIADATLDLKFRFWENDGLSFAIKPGISLPTGDKDKDLGAGKVGYHVSMIGTKEIDAWTFLGNVGYIRNETDSSDTEKNIWHVSFATIYSINEQWKVAADVVAERNSEKDNNTAPVSGIIGLIFSPTKNIDLDLGLKAGLNDEETDWALMAGTTFRF
jgi:hypothetical protein